MHLVGAVGRCGAGDPLRRGPPRGGAELADRPGFKGKNDLSGSIPDGAFAKPMDKAAVLKAVQPFLTS